MLGKRNIKRHEYDGPYDGVETHYLLADEMHIGRPVPPVQLIIIGEIAEL